MDTGTHLVIGLGLGGLAAVDPVIAGNSTVHTAVLIGTVIGSQAPDFDTLFRFKGNASYIRNHRGASHSIPAIVVWTALISIVLQLFYRGSLPWLHLIGWVLLSVCVHVITDLFNAYGTQAIKPFSNKWISWNIIHIFDPVIFTSHVIAISVWAFGLVNPAIVFPLLYGVLAVYYVWRTTVHFRQKALVESLDKLKNEGDKYWLIPTISLHDWNVVKKKKDGSFVIGDLRSNHLRWLHQVNCSSHPAVEKSKNDPSIASFLYITSFACADVKEHSWGYEVRWSDVRYRHRKQYPFVAVLMMDKDFKTVGSYVGWLSDKRLEKRLRMNTY
ncbi:metal-dependent hydrolase [Paenibacillus xylaniclasticus]|uniref:metal-dependent hydrolase n=1 Tax=Paenibacillus xylaniclasticus TaxID=588083 RepID=UPI000FDB5E0B|nr:MULTISPECIES: metal-dependent hydrolase [Paenibacillus]GFN31209.1 hypothetical protein PCURB6_14690 [Paenibacillus curdlanolyticus]